MREPDPRTSRLAIGGGLVAAIIVGGAGFLLGRTAAPRPAPTPVATIAPPTPVSTPTSNPDRVLARGDLLELAEQAADAFASGEAVPAAVSQAAGRRFDLVLPFGCAGPSDAAAGAAMGWRHDPATQTLRVSAMPVTWSGADWNMGQANDAEKPAAAGFWISRPWSSSERCPPRAGETAVATGTDPVTLPGQTLAIAGFGATAGLARDGRPFETVQRVAAESLDTSQGFRLHLTGRIDRRANGPVRCVQPGGVEQRPICALAAVVDEVRIENAATDAVLATWTIDRTG